MQSGRERWPYLMIDTPGSIILLIWVDRFPKIEDGNYYRLTNMKLKCFNGKRLSTQCFKDVINIVPLCCPTVLNKNIIMYPVCGNLVYKKKLNVPANSTIASCCSCGRKLLVKKVKFDKNTLLQLAEKQSLYSCSG